jgi:hypothetical protein
MNQKNSNISKGDQKTDLRNLNSMEKEIGILGAFDDSGN